jgi:hypothetical protein
MQNQDERLDQLHTGQRAIADEIRGLKAGLPVQRRPLSRFAQEMHVKVIASRRNGLCPCCQESPVCNYAGRLPGAEFDHWYSRDKNRVNATWLVCGACNQRLNVDTDFKAASRSVFEAYQAALAPFVSGRQGSLFRAG